MSYDDLEQDILGDERTASFFQPFFHKNQTYFPQKFHIFSEKEKKPDISKIPLESVG